MGNSNWKTVSCCVSKSDLIEAEIVPHPQMLSRNGNSKHRMQSALHYHYDFETVKDYLEEHFIIEIQKEGDLEIIKRINERVMLVKLGKDAGILKKIKFTESDSYLDRIILKELRLIVSNQKLNFLNKLKGFMIEEDSESPDGKSISILYEYHETKLDQVVKQLTYINKIKLFRKLLEMIKQLHSNGIIGLKFNQSTLRFKSDFSLILNDNESSINMKTNYDIDRSSIISSDMCNICTPPEIHLNKLNLINWQCDIWELGVLLSHLFSSNKIPFNKSTLIHDYKEEILPEFFYSSISCSTYIKAIVIGLLRINQTERPNIFEVIDVYNQFVEAMNYGTEFKLEYTKDEVLNFTKIFLKSTYILLKNEYPKEEMNEAEYITIRGVGLNQDI